MSEETMIAAVIHKMEQWTIVRAIRSGLVRMIPVLTVGAFSLILQTFPVEGYQQMIGRFAGGFFLELFQLIYSATFGVLSLYMTFSISRSYMKIKSDPDTVMSGATVASMLSFFILAGAYLPDFGTEQMGPKSMFLAILTGLGASALYLCFERFFRARRRVFLSTGADREFNRMLAALPPISFTAIAFALLNSFVMRLFQVDSFHTLLTQAFNGLFSRGSTGFLKGLFFIFLSSLLWLFGIHGSDTLESVMQTYFSPGLALNQAALAAGETPQSVLTKEFFDCFVLMGGCGSTICLLLAILLFSHNRARRGLGLTAAFPMLFNINELMVFGLPIIFNPAMMIPFLCVPLVCYSVAYAAISAGMVPMITGSVAWTTPILLGGFRATGSMAGSLLQLVNVGIGVLIYFPFVRLLDRQTEAAAQENYNSFMEFFRAHEQEFSAVRLTELTNVYGDFAKGLCAELQHGKGQHFQLAYQPQYNYSGQCIGVEALLRWQHPTYGMLYPPLVIKLAEEGGFLSDLEESVLSRALSERPLLLQRFGDGIKLSVNVTGSTVVKPHYLQFCRQLNDKEAFAGKNICIEVTEQTAVSFHEETLRTLRSMREMGLLLAIDDFSMGHTSLHYLKNNMFDLIKLDGSLVKGLFDNQNCREIISSITRLAESLRLTVLAEYVQTEEQRDILHSIGCDNYQGYLYAAPVLLADKQER